MPQSTDLATLSGVVQNSGAFVAATASQVPAATVIKAGQELYVIETKNKYVGDGVTAFSSLPVVGSSVGANPVVIGTGTTSATGDGSVVIGKNAVSGLFTDAVAIGTSANVTGNKGVAIGRGSTANGGIALSSNNAGATATAQVGGFAVTVGDTFSTSAASNNVAIGQSCNASGPKVSFALGSGAQATGAASFVFSHEGALRSGTASASNSVGFGPSVNAQRVGQFSLGADAFANAGDAQWSNDRLRATTTDATPTVMTLCGATNAWLTLSSTRTISGRISISAHRTDVSGTAAAWPNITFAATRDATGNVRLLGAVTGTGTTTFSDAGATTWSVSVTANTVNNSVDITVTGEAGKTIRWVATADFTEVG